MSTRIHWPDNLYRESRKSLLLLKLFDLIINLAAMVIFCKKREVSDSEMEHLSLNLSVSVVRSILSLARVRALLAIGVFALPAGENVRATTIGINLGSSPRITSQVTVPVDALNGVSLNGQTLSLNFMFTNSEFVRLFTATTASFAASLKLVTDGSGLVGFLGGTGELLDQQGNALQTPQVLGSASGDDGSMLAVLFPLLSGQLQKPLDFFGIHYDLTLPTNSSVAVTGAEFQLITAGLNHDDRIGIGPGVPRDIVPDAGSTLLLFCLGLIAVLGIPKRTSFAG